MNQVWILILFLINNYMIYLEYTCKFKEAKYTFKAPVEGAHTLSSSPVAISHSLSQGNDQR